MPPATTFATYNPRNVFEQTLAIPLQTLGAIHGYSGAASAALIALATGPRIGLVFSGSNTRSAVTNHGPGTLIQQNPLDGVFVPVHGGHQSAGSSDVYRLYRLGAGIRRGGHIPELSEPDIAALLARLLGLTFPMPDGHLVPGILRE